MGEIIADREFVEIDRRTFREKTYSVSHIQAQFTILITADRARIYGPPSAETLLYI